MNLQEKLRFLVKVIDNQCDFPTVLHLYKLLTVLGNKKF